MAARPSPSRACTTWPSRAPRTIRCPAGPCRSSIWRRPRRSPAPTVSAAPSRSATGPRRRWRRSATTRSPCAACGWCPRAPGTAAATSTGWSARRTFWRCWPNGARRATATRTAAATLTPSTFSTCSRTGAPAPSPRTTSARRRRRSAGPTTSACMRSRSTSLPQRRARIHSTARVPRTRTSGSACTTSPACRSASRSRRRLRC